MINKHGLTDADMDELLEVRRMQQQQRDLGIVQEQVMERPSPVSVSTVPVKAMNENFIRIEGLPSRDMFYVDPIYGQSLKVNDLILIQTIDDTNVESIFDQVYARRIHGIDPMEIIDADDYFLALWLRSTSYLGYNFPSEDITCENNQCKYVIKGEEAEFNIMNIEFVTPDVNEFNARFNGAEYVYTQITPTLKVGVCMRRRKHNNLKDRYIAEMYTAKGQVVTEQVSDLISMCTVIDFGIPNLSNGMPNIYKKLQLLTDLDVGDFAKVVKFYNENTFTSNENVHHKCPKCGKTTVVRGYPFRKAIYFPYNS